MKRYSVAYVIGFAAAVCAVCSLLVSGAAVLLKDRQDANKLLDRRTRILIAAGLAADGEELSREEVDRRFLGAIRPRVIEQQTGAYDDTADPAKMDFRRDAKDPDKSSAAPDNRAKVQRVPQRAVVYHVMADDAVDAVVLPVHGMGLWSTMYGYLALEEDGETVRGLVFYEHGETPGLGAEVDNPRWKALWPGRKIFDDSGAMALEVIKGRAGPAQQDPYRVDGLSGATLTSRGVTHMLDFWLGDAGFGPYLAQLRRQTP